MRINLAFVTVCSILFSNASAQDSERNFLNTPTAEYSCSEISLITDITQTTGGSVWIFGVFFTDGRNFNVNEYIPGREGSRERINLAWQRLHECQGKDTKIMLSWYHEQDEIFTFDGILRGKITNNVNLNIFSDKDNTLPRESFLTSPKVEYSCSQISYITNITQTTGGSVWIFGVYFSDGSNFNVNEYIPGREGAAERTSLAWRRLQACRGKDAKILLGWYREQDEIDTLEGTLTGKTTNNANLDIYLAMNNDI